MALGIAWILAVAFWPNLKRLSGRFNPRPDLPRSDPQIDAMMDGLRSLSANSAKLAKEAGRLAGAAEELAESLQELNANLNKLTDSVARRARLLMW